ncbi:hypothetical protein AQ505_09505 [Pedobacter sp. PACM 27299]|uniref:glycoside hydrolase family 16 protein n=1 Tax=Pedobacter sp. PACM 27299 TaxID=1727164 RepID=UPI000705B810|nr:glycoside hydrolase family 16 protein [Pedobacter sp. PACM 27299]ALL05706.1 hypothetical protein AQ505_09505 [Pedobacter sp. PACM 27299]
MKKIIGFAGLLTVILGLSFCKKSEKPAVIGKNFPTESITPKGATWVMDATKSDEFDKFDVSKWSAAPLWYYGGVTGDFAYKTANTEVNGGKAHLIAKKEVHNNIADPDFQRQYTAGCLKSKFEVGGDSYIEVRAKMINALANVCAAIWLGDDPVLEKNPNIEIDMQETKNADNKPHLLNTSLLTWPKPGNGNTVPGFTNYYFSWGLDEDFHLYGLERRNGKLKFYLDGLQYWEYDAKDVPEFITQMRPIILSIEGHAGAPNAALLPSNFEIDWVRVFKLK